MVMRAYQNACAAAVTRSGGHVAKFLGDGVLAYFGWPLAYEDAAERAVRAGLEVVDVVPRLVTSAHEPLSARVGVATGIAVVGDLLGAGAAREEAVVGEVANVAARLQQLAEPGTIVIADRTRRLLAGMFDLVDLASVSLRGLPEPVRAWRVVGERDDAASRFEARQAAGLAPLVGREHELTVLLERWRLVRDGNGQAVLLMGEPGVGKSRLAEALAQRLADEPHAHLLCQCSPQHTGSAFYPIAAHLERAAGFRREDEAGTRLAKLATLLTKAGVEPRHCRRLPACSACRWKRTHAAGTSAPPTKGASYRGPAGLHGRHRPASTGTAGGGRPALDRSPPPLSCWVSS